MKDAYSFDARRSTDCRRVYQAMYDAYCRVFERCGLTFRSVEAQSGEMGGRRAASSWPSPRSARTTSSGARTATTRPTSKRRGAGAHARMRTDGSAVDGSADGGGAHARPARHRRRGGVPRRRRRAAMLKCIVFDVDGELGLALVPGDREVNEFALAAALAPKTVRLYGDDDFAEASRAAQGLHRPALPGRDRRGRRSVGAPAPRLGHGREPSSTTTCATRCSGRDFDVDIWADLVDDRPRRSVPAAAGSRSRSTAASKSATSSSSARSTAWRSTRCTPTSKGEQHPMVMGCYGIGVSRILAAVAEEYHDESGLAWPAGARAVRRAPHRGARPRRAAAAVIARGRSRLRGADRAWCSPCSTTTATRARA